MKINLKRGRLIGVLFVAMMLVGMDAFAQRIRVQGHITNPQGKSVPNVNVLNPVNDERIEMSDEDGRYSVLVEKNGSLKFTCVGYEDKTVKVRLNEKRRMSFKEKREFEQLEQEIADLETEKKAIEEALCSGTLSVDELTEKSKRLPELSDLIDEKTLRWLELSEIESN